MFKGGKSVFMKGENMPMMNVHLFVWVSRLTDVSIELIGQAINNDSRSTYDEFELVVKIQGHF